MASAYSGLAELVLRDDAPPASAGVVRETVVGAPIAVGVGAQRRERTPTYTTYRHSGAAVAAAGPAGPLAAGATRTVTYTTYASGAATDAVAFSLPLPPLSPARASATVPAPEAFVVPSLSSPERTAGATSPGSAAAAGTSPRRSLLLRSRVSSEADTLAPLAAAAAGCGGPAGAPCV